MLGERLWLFQCRNVRNMVIPSSTSLGEARGERQLCLPGFICQMLEGPVPTVGLGRLGLMQDLGLEQHRER